MKYQKLFFPHFFPFISKNGKKKKKTKTLFFPCFSVLDNLVFGQGGSLYTQVIKNEKNWGEKIVPKNRPAIIMALRLVFFLFWLFLDVRFRKRRKDCPGALDQVLRFVEQQRRHIHIHTNIINGKKREQTNT